MPEFIKRGAELEKQAVEAGDFSGLSNSQSKDAMDALDELSKNATNVKILDDENIITEEPKVETSPSETKKKRVRRSTKTAEGEATSSGVVGGPTSINKAGVVNIKGAVKIDGSPKITINATNATVGPNTNVGKIEFKRIGGDAGGGAGGGGGDGKGPKTPTQSASKEDAVNDALNEVQQKSQKELEKELKQKRASYSKQYENLLKQTYAEEERNAKLNQDLLNTDSYKNPLLSAELARQIGATSGYNSPERQEQLKKLREQLREVLSEDEVKSIEDKLGGPHQMRLDDIAKRTSQLQDIIPQRYYNRYVQLQNNIAKEQYEKNRRQLYNKRSPLDRMENTLLDEQSDMKIAEWQKELDGRDWEKLVGGAEAYARANQEVANSTNLLRVQQDKLSKYLNPTIWDNLKSSVQGYLAQLKNGSLMWMFVAYMRRGFQQIIQGAQELDKAMTNLRVVLGDSREDVRNLMTDYSELGQQLSATTTEVANAANEWLRQGYSIAETNDLISASLHLSKLGMIDSGQATEYLTSMLKGFKLEASDAMEVVDKLTKVDMAAATSAGDIAASLQNFASTAQLSGVDIDEAIAMATTIMDVSQKGASTVGDALKTVLSRYGNVKPGVFSGMSLDSEGIDDSVNDIEKVLSKLGISIRESNLEFRDFSDVLEEIGEKWDSFDEVTQNAIATAMAGTRQRESFLVLMENMDKYHELTEISQNSFGTAEEKYLSYQESLEASQKEFASAWENLALNADVSRFMKTVTDFMTGLVNNLPTVLRWIVKIFSVIQAYKMPSWISTFVNTLGIGRGLDAASNLWDAYHTKGKLKGLWGEIKAKGFTGKAATRYYHAHHPEANGIDNYNPLLGEGYSPLFSGGYKPSLSSNIPTTPSYKGVWKKGYISVVTPGGDLIDIPTPDLPIQEIAKENARWKTTSRNLFDQGNRLKIIKERVTGTKTSYRAQYPFALEEDTYKNKRYINDYSGIVASSLSPNAKYQMSVGSYDGTTSSATLDKSINSLNQALVKNTNAVEGNTDATNNANVIPDENGNLVSPTGKKQGKFSSKFTKFFTSLPGMMISSGALGAGLGALSASSTHYTASGQNVENSATAQGVSTGMSAAIGGISSALGVLGPWGAVAGLITQIVGSGLTTLITQWIDAERDARNERVETANSILKTLDQINSNTAELKDFVKTNDWSYDSTQAWKEQISELRKSFSLEENQKAAEQIWQNLLNNNGGGKSLEFNGIEYYSLDAFLRALGQASGDIADQGFAMFTKAQNQTERTNQIGAQENNIYNLSNEYTGSIIETLKNHQMELAHELYEDGIQGLGPLTVSDEAMLSSAIDSLKYDNKTTRAFYEALMDYLKSNNSGLDQDILKELAGLQDDYVNKLAEYYSDYNEGVANEALQNAVGFNGTRLLDMSEWNLSKMSPDEIIQAVTDAVLKEGSFMGIDVTSQKGQQLIESIIKENETLYNAMTGKSYTLSQAFDLEDNEEILRQFATALNVPMSELDRMRELVGDIKLGDLVEGLESLRESASELSDLLDQIASNGGLSNESIESIVKNFPSLVPYLDDTAKLVEELLKQSSQYNISYGTAMWGEISSSQGLYQEFLDSLGTTNLGAKDKLLGDFSPFKQADSIQPLLAFLGALQNSPLEEVNKQYGFDFTEQEVADILKVYTEKYTTTFKDIITETLVSIPQKMVDTLLEKQLDNLNAQKEALQNINDEREYENKLIEAKLKLENAQTEKRRVWREGVGWTYESDQSAIKEAQENLESVTNENKISELDRQIAETQALKDQNASIQDEQAFEQLAQAFAGWQDSFDSAIGAEGLFGQMDGSLDALVEFIKGLQAGSFSIKVDAGEQAGTEAKKKEEDLGSLKEEAAKLQEMQAGLSTPSGMTDDQWHASDEYKQKESEYNKAVSDYQKHWDTHNKQYGDEDYNA